MRITSNTDLLVNWRAWAFPLMIEVWNNGTVLVQIGPAKFFRHKIKT